MPRHMFKRLLLLIALCTASTAALAKPVKIVVFGDSLTSGYQLPAAQGYPAVLQQLLRSRGYTETEVINMSVAGETALNAYSRVPDVIALRPDIVMVELGYNDVLQGMDPGTQVYTSV